MTPVCKPRSDFKANAPSVTALERKVQHAHLSARKQGYRRPSETGGGGLLPFPPPLPCFDILDNDHKNQPMCTVKSQFA